MASRPVGIDAKTWKHVQKHVHWLLRSARVATGRPSWEYDVRIAMTVSTLRFRGVPSDDRLRRHLLHRALTQLKASGLLEPDKDEVAASLETVLQEYFNKPHVQYVVLFPLWLGGTWITHKLVIHVLDVTFRRWSWRRVRGLAGWEQFNEKAELHIGLSRGPRPFQLDRSAPLVAEIHSRTHKEAIDEAIRSFDLLRSIVNLMMQYGRSTRQFGRPSPLGKCMPPAVYGVFTGAGDYETIYYSVEQHGYRSGSKLSYEQGRAVERLLADLNASSNYVRSLVTDLLLKYGEAMDTADWKSAFLSLWRLLEAAALQTRDQQVKTRTIKARILSLRSYYPFMCDCLDMLERSRHELVHQGRFSEEGLQRVTFLKLFAEETLLTVLDLGRRFHTRMLLGELYEQLAEQSETTLKARQRAIEYVWRKKYCPPS